MIRKQVAAQTGDQCLFCFSQYALPIRRGWTQGRIPVAVNEAAPHQLGEIGIQQLEARGIFWRTDRTGR
jgi:hypothetical protein